MGTLFWRTGSLSLSLAAAHGLVAVVVYILYLPGLRTTLYLLAYAFVWILRRAREGLIRDPGGEIKGVTKLRLAGN